MMQDLLGRMVGKRLDVYCGGASSLRGEVLKVDGGVLHLRDDEGQVCYVAVERIIVVWEARDEDERRAGFVASRLK
jgi:hypothetical protein